MTFATRRARNATIAGLLLLLAWGIHSVVDVSLPSTAGWSGRLLRGVVIARAVFNVRKKLPFLPLGAGAAWMQFHAYAGFFSIVVFLVHVDFRMPNGALEGALAALFSLVAVSGILGLLITRALPVRLTTRGEAILFDRIPLLRRKLHDEVEELVLDCARKVQTTTISDFYSERLVDFLRRPRYFAYHLADSALAYQNLEREMWALDRYLNPEEREVLEQIHECVRLKNDLDYQWTQQLALRGWLFFHIPMTYSLMIFAALHVLLAFGFDGDLR
jgi:hypothetical protein